MLNHGVTFNLGSAKVFLFAIFKTYFSYHKDTLIAVTDFYMYFYLIVLFSLAAILKQILQHQYFSLVINAVILLLNCLVLVLYLYIHFLSLKHDFLHLHIIWTFA